MTTPGDSLYYLEAKSLIKGCKRTSLNWFDLSKDVIMDVGCGEFHNVCRVIREEFQGVGNMLAIDKNPFLIESIRRNNTDISAYVADIEQSESLQTFAGKMNKVISCHAFDQVRDKIAAFRNVFLLLKAGGEAAILYNLKTGVDFWLKELSSMPKWSSMYQPDNIEDMYYDIATLDYETMMGEIGFNIIQCTIEDKSIAYLTDYVCKEAVYDVARRAFRVPNPLVEEFKEESFRIFVKHNGRDAFGKPRYWGRNVYILLSKPTEGSSS